MSFTLSTNSEIGRRIYEQIAYIKEETRRINELLKDWFAQIGLRLIDFKLEFGFDKDGKTLICLFLLIRKWVLLNNILQKVFVSYQWEY